MQKIERQRFVSPFFTCAPVAVIVLLASVLTSQAYAQGLDLPDNPLKDPDQWLTDQRWSELRYGLSIRTPHRAKAVYDTPQGDSVRWALEDGTRIRISFAHGIYETIKNNRVVQLPARVDLLKKHLGEEMRATVHGQVINTRSDQVVEVGDLVGIINYYIIKPEGKNRKPFLYGVALLQMDQMSVTVIRLECPPDRLVSAVSTFECMIHSIQSESAKEVNRRIHGWLVNSEELLAKTTQKNRLDVMRNDKLYRVLEAGKDIGYVRIWQRFQDEAFYKQRAQEEIAQGGDGKLAGIFRFKETGNAVIVQSHYRGNGVRMDRLFEAIHATKKDNVYWQIKNSLNYDNDPGNRRAGTWVETGLQTPDFKTDRLQITREGTPPKHMVDFLLQRERDPEKKLRYPSADPRSFPAGDLIEKGWDVPKRAFLSVVDYELMPALLPSEAKTYAFTTYDPNATKIDICVMRVEPAANGGKTVYLRPAINQSPQTLRFDRNNDLISHVYPDGRELRRTTRSELARVWGVRLKD